MAEVSTFQVNEKIISEFSKSGRMRAVSLSLSGYAAALMWLKELEAGEAAAPRTSCASREIIVLLLRRVQHLLISIMGYAPARQATPSEGEP